MGQCLFPNASLHVQESEWVFWTDENLLNAVPEYQKPNVELIQSLARKISSQIETHSGDKDLWNGIHLAAAPGHTPGHQIVRISHGDKQIALLGDALVSGVLQFSNPDVHYALDGDPQTAAETRRTLFAELAKDRIPFAATHLETMDFGVITTTGEGGYRFEALN